MTLKAKKFSPEAMLSAPRRTSLPNSDGSRLLFSNSSYSFKDHEWTREIKVLDVKGGASSLITKKEGASEPQWLDEDHILFLAPAGEDSPGATEVFVAKSDTEEDCYSAGIIDGSAANMKIKRRNAASLLFGVSVQAKPDGGMFNAEKAKKRNNTGRVYSSLFTRHWDSWTTSNRNAIWTGALKRQDDGKYTLSKLTNVLKGTGLESPIPPFGGADDYDLSERGVVFVAKDPAKNPATNTISNVYLMQREGFDGENQLPDPFKIAIAGVEGASSSPRFSADGIKVAYLQMTKNGYESDRNEIFVIQDVRRPGWILHLGGFPGEIEREWDLSPSSIDWEPLGRWLYIQAERNGTNRLWQLPAGYGNQLDSPSEVFSAANVGSLHVLNSGDLILQTSSMIDNSAVYHLTRKQAPPGSTPSYAQRCLHSVSRHGALFGLSTNQIDEIWFDGGKQKVHAWIMKPSTFERGKKYPLAYLIHGGPQGAWTNAWNTRWNPAVFAEQGYVAIMPNPTGSSGYGEGFKDAIENQWGGLPYIDIAKGFEYIKENLDYVDTDRAVALGASYGGYMMNWIQGMPLGRKLKAIVCHDGVYSIAGQMASEELYFPEREFGGKWWENRESWLKWDPARFVENWATPQLVIHSERDYRLTVAEGLAAFNALQDRGVESQFLTFPDENHWVLKPENSLLWHTVVFDWINQKVGLPPYSEQSPVAKAALEEAAVES